MVRVKGDCVVHSVVSIEGRRACVGVVFSLDSRPPSSELFLLLPSDGRVLGQRSGAGLGVCVTGGFGDPVVGHGGEGDNS